MITQEKCVVEFLDKFHQYVKDGRILKDECVRVIDPPHKLTLRSKILHIEGLHEKKLIAIRKGAVQVCSRNPESTIFYLRDHPGYIRDASVRFTHQDGSTCVTTALIFEYEKVRNDFDKLFE